MTATPTLLAGYLPYSDHNPIPVAFARPLAASEQVGLGQFVTVNRSTGYAMLNDGATPNQIVVGNGAVPMSDTSAVAGNAKVRVNGSFLSGLAASTVANDGFTDADYAVPCYIASENTVGKLSNYSGSNRSLAGLVLGLDTFDRPVVFSGAIAWLLARAALKLDATVGGFAHVAADDDGTDYTAVAMVRTPVHGRVSAITITSALGTITANNSDYKEINVYKADGAGGAPVLLGSYNSTVGSTTGVGSLAAGVPKAFLLSTVAGALDLLETDILQFTVTHHGSTGVVVPDCVLSVVQKVQ